MPAAPWCVTSYNWDRIRTGAARLARCTLRVSAPGHTGFHIHTDTKGVTDSSAASWSSERRESGWGLVKAMVMWAAVVVMALVGTARSCNQARRDSTWFTDKVGWEDGKLKWMKTRV